jgi:ferredoxin
VDADLFPIDDDGYSLLQVHDVPADRLDSARKGVDACPEVALSLTD